MIKVYSNAKSRHDRKLLSDAQQVLNDSRTKIEVLRMNIIRLKSVMNSGETEGSSQRSGPMGSVPQTPDARIALLRYRVDVETRLMQGARSIMKANPHDKKNWQSVSPAVFCVHMCTCADTQQCTCNNVYSTCDMHVHVQCKKLYTVRW